ncbi:TVG1011675 [Thermoplasma volcanium GSS1]|uniref:TVG1011675 protein n=1 Tax=Thermoplasma volcanium (strain ATCC 51530 / DSM 4299 / JCM 9571 / NBRC 15438 / GSS1) TaxID=273116 RepID=Q97A20_THEVO|nr:TVG1011675 [Thermoplasma volcanium GSS1]
MWEYRDMMKRMVYPVRIDTIRYDRKFSFVVFVEDIQSSHQIIDNIMDIGDEIGYPYEVIVSAKDQVTDDYYSDEIKVVGTGLNRRSDGIQRSLKSSTGNYFVIFDPNIRYSLSYADLLYGYAETGSSEVLVSEILGFQTDVLRSVGGWRDLSYGEDIDLLVRVIDNYGVITYPFYGLKQIDLTELIKSTDSIRSGKIKKLRDLIISCNFKYQDIKTIAKILDKSSRISRLLYLSKILSNFARIRPYERPKNNYLTIMERIMESILAKEFLKITTVDFKPSLAISTKTAEYLAGESPLWRITEENGNFVREKI